MMNSSIPSFYFGAFVLRFRSCWEALFFFPCPLYIFFQKMDTDLLELRIDFLELFLSKSVDESWVSKPTIPTSHTLKKRRIHLD